MAEHITVRVNGDRMREVAASNGLGSVIAISRKIGVSRSYLQQVLAGSRTVGVEFVVKVHEHFGVNFPGDYRYPDFYQIQRKELD